MAQTKAQLIDGKGAVDLGALSINGSAPDNSVNLDASGRFLVGTSSSVYSSSLLTVKGGVSTSVGDFNLASTVANITSGNDIGAIRITNTNGYRGAQIIATADGNWTEGSSQPTYLAFSTTASGGVNPTERMRIDNLGRIFTYNANTGNNSLTVASAAAAGTAVANFIGAYGATGVNTGTSSFIVWTNGNVQNTNNSYTAISDVKLKENIVDANSQWADIKALQVRNYNLKEGQTHKQIGLIAQEVELISPGLISESPDLDAEGNDLGTVTKAVNYSVLYMKAVKALQEAMERIEQLEAEMAEVKAQLS